MPSLAARIDRLEQDQSTGLEAEIRAMPDAELEAEIRGWDFATWGRILAAVGPEEAEEVIATMRRLGPGPR